VSIESRVVTCDIRNNISFLPIKALIKLDFPAFGLPTTAKRGNAISSCVGSGFIEMNQLMHP
jgi:hypothetical protein